MSQLPLVTPAHRVIELRQQIQAGLSDADFHDAAVVRHPLAGNQSALFQLVE